MGAVARDARATRREGRPRPVGEAQHGHAKAERLLAARRQEATTRQATLHYSYRSLRKTCHRVTPLLFAEAFFCHGHPWSAGLDLPEAIQGVLQSDEVIRHGSHRDRPVMANGEH